MAEARSLKAQLNADVTRGEYVHLIPDDLPEPVFRADVLPERLRVRVRSAPEPSDGVTPKGRLQSIGWGGVPSVA